MYGRLPEYRSFAALAAAHVEGRDFTRTVKLVEGSNVVVIAPHGGRIEPQTDVIATRLAGSDFSLYCFRSHLPTDEANLHITSHNFDDPACLSLVASRAHVIAIHGWASQGEALLVGGLDTDLGNRLATAARALEVVTLTDSSALSGTHPRNVCNRGKTGRGVQIELTMALRRSDKLPRLLSAIRSVLLQRDGVA